MITISDRINPIIVKEVRQAARSRTFIVMIVLTVLSCTLIGLRALATRRELGDPSAAEDVFFALYFCLSIAGFLVVPFVAHRSLAREQEDGAWELLQLTGLGPRRILAGKLASTLVHGGFFGLLVLPFLSLAYFKGGVGLANLLGLGIFGMALTGGLSVFALFTAAVPAGRAQRTGMQLATLVGLMFAVGMGYGFARVLVRERVFVDGIGDSARDNFFLVAAFVSALLSSCVVLFEAAVSRLSLGTERYARGARLAVAAATGVISGFCFLWWRAGEADGDVRHAPLVAAGLTALLGFAAALGFGADADRPRGRGAEEPALLRPGAVWGLRYVALLLAVPTLFWLAFALLRRGGEDAAAIAAAPCYVLILISVPLIVCRGLRFGKLASPDVVRGVALVLMLFCSVLPAAAIEVSGATSSVWAALPSPFLAIDRLDGDPARAKTEAAVLLGVLALALTVAADRVLVARERRAG